MEANSIVKSLRSSTSNVVYKIFYTPQKNGVEKRMNMTLMEKARSMLSGTGLAK